MLQTFGVTELDYEKRKQIIEKYKKGIRNSYSHALSNGIDLNTEPDEAECKKDYTDKDIMKRLEKIYSISIAALILSMLSLAVSLLMYLKK